MSDEPKYPPNYNAELIDQYETFMRDRKAAHQASNPATSETEEKPKSEPAAAAKRLFHSSPLSSNPTI
jgi:hypothetical protein